jgi:Putative zinc-finger
MECRAVVTSMSDYIDMWMSESEVREIESHLVTCPNCQSVRLELHEIKTAARELPLHNPSRSLWMQIAAELEREPPSIVNQRPKTIKQAEKLNRWERLKTSRFTFTLPQLAGACALVAFLVVFLMKIPNPTRSNFDFTGGSQALQTALLPNEDRIRADLEQKLSAINSRKANWDPTVRVEFERHLNKIDDSLRNTRQILLINPGDRVQQQMVLTLYNEKRQLLEDVERLKW